jgi:hypothetical protein
VLAASTSAAVRERVVRSRDHFWRPDDFDGPTSAVAKALSRSVAAGELCRIRRGLYWRGRMTPLGMAPPPVARLAAELVDEPGSGPAGASAALALGLATQVPRHEVIAITGRAPRPTPGVRFVTRESAWRRSDARLRPADVATLEVLRVWPDVVEVDTGEAVARIGRLAAAGTIDFARIVRAAGSEPPLVRERLRHLLDALDRRIDAAKVRPARTDSVDGRLGTVR